MVKMFYGWVVVMVGALLTFLGTGFYSYSRGVFLPSLSEELANGGRFEIAMGFSMAAVTNAVMGPYLGHVLDYRSPRRIMLFGILITTVSYVLLSYVQTLWQFYLIVGLGFGVGMACMGTLAWHRPVISWFDHWRGRAISLGVLGASCAGIFMPPLVTDLVQDYGWRNTYLIFAALVLVILFPVVWRFMVDRPEDKGEIRDGHAYAQANPVQAAAARLEAENEARIWTWGEMFRSPAFWAIGIMFGGMGCVFSAVMLHLYGHGLDIGLTGLQSAALLSTVALLSALGKPVVGWMSDVWGARVTIWLALICQAVSLVLFATVDSYTASLVSACVYGFGLSGMSPLRTFALSVSMGSASFGRANGALRLVELPLVISASPLAGYIYDSTGSYRIAFLVLAGMMALSCIGPLFIRAGGAKQRQLAPALKQQT